MVGRGFILGLALAFGISAAAGQSAVAQGGAVDREYQLKAAFLYNFALYTDWPKNAVPGDDKIFVIGVLGPNPFGQALDKIAASRKIRDRKIVVHRFTSVKDYRSCHLLFVSAEKDANADEKTLGARAKAVLAKTKGSPVLLIGDRKGLAQQGMVVDFVIEENKLKLEINRAAMARARLKLSARLLELKVVKFVEDGAVVP